MSKLAKIVLIVGVIIIIVGLFFIQPERISSLSAPNGSLTIIIADEPAEHELGLSGRDSLAPNEGMLFIFEKPGIYGFWMKDMKFPIDIIWLDSNYRVLGLAPNVLPSSYPNLYYPPSNISQVLEINAGTANSLGIATGTILKK